MEEIMKQTDRIITIILLITAITSSCSSNEQDVFRRVERICNKDGGRLWGINIYAPILGIDTQRNVVSNMPDAPKTFPLDQAIANSTTVIDGRKWTMVVWPLTGKEQQQNELLIHEMFHYHQTEIGLLPQEMPNNAHLSNRDARTLLKLEWNALKEAAASRGSKSMQAMTDALNFRKLRRELYPDFIGEENALEILEGLAEYTGRRLTSSSDKKFIANLSCYDNFYQSDNLTRTFAYLSGPLYGFLLDRSGADWQKSVTASSDLGEKHSLKKDM